MKALHTAPATSGQPTRLASFKELYEALTKFPDGSEDDQLFKELFDHSQYLLEMKDTSLAELFQVSRPTISRWADGQSAPHPLARKTVISELAKLVEERVAFLAKRPEYHPSPI